MILAAAMMALSLTLVPAAHAKPDKNRAPASLDAKKLFDLVDENCAGNDNGRTGTFDPAKFSAVEAMKNLKKDAKGCKDRIYSSSREDAVKMFRTLFEDKDNDFHRCLHDKSYASNDHAFTKEERAEIMRVVADPSNLGVFASEHGAGRDDSEACLFWHVHIYRADGTLIEFVHDETD
jgi:hypothetical protein